MAMAGPGFRGGHVSDVAKTLVFARLWRTIGWLMLGTVVALTLTPSPPKLKLALLSWDKAQHTLAYALLAWWFLQAWVAAATRNILVGLVLLGIVLEIAQGLMGVRFMEITDMVANGIGVVVGYMLARTPLGDALSWLDGRMSRALRGGG